MYYFYRLFTISEEKFRRELIYEDVIISKDKDTAKKYITESHGNYPFRKTKTLGPGDSYYYISESNEYWYKYHHEIYHIRCANCGREIDITGGKNMYQHRNRFGEYCCSECRDIYTKK